LLMQTVHASRDEKNHVEQGSRFSSKHASVKGKEQYCKRGLRGGGVSAEPASGEHRVSRRTSVKESPIKNPSSGKTNRSLLVKKPKQPHKNNKNTNTKEGEKRQ